MSAPHFFVWSGGVINLARVIHASVDRTEVVASKRISTRVKILLDSDKPTSSRFEEDGEFLVLEGEEIVGEFMLMCSRYHHFGKKEGWPDVSVYTPPKPIEPGTVQTLKPLKPL